MMDDDVRRLAELENQVEELEKDTGRLTAQLDAARSCIADLQRMLVALTKRADALERGQAEMTDVIQTLSEDVDGTIEDMNLLSDEMRRRLARMLARQEQFFWDAAEPEEEDNDEAE